MYLVKSFPAQFNPRSCGTIQIGTIEYYRNHYNDDIRDENEGRSTVTIDLTNHIIDIDVFNDLNKSNSSLMTAKVKYLSVTERLARKMRVTFNAEYSRSNRNAFIFCASRLKRLPNTSLISSEYNDFWHANIKKSARIGDLMALDLKKEISNRIKGGENLFTQNIMSPDQIQVSCRVQRVTYLDKMITITNGNYGSQINAILGALRGHLFYKDEKFKHESEVRFLFQASLNGVELTPLIDTILIPSDNLIGEIVFSSNLNR